MVDVQRPALAPVLAALTDLPVEVWAVWLTEPPSPIEVYDHSACVRLAQWRPQGYAMGPAPWTTRDPAEAWEILDARGLLPPDGARSFDVGAAIADIIRNAPPRSRGNGGSRGDAGFIVYDDITARLPTYAIERGDVRVDAVLSDDERDERFTVEGALAAAARQWPHPATIPDLVAWASLGAEAIVTAEALAMEACATLQRMGAPWAMTTCERVVWRVAQNSGGRMAFESLRAGRAMAPSGRMFLIDDEVVMPTQEFVTAPGAIWDMGLALERVGAECVVCVPPIGGSRG